MGTKIGDSQGYNLFVNINGNDIKYEEFVTAELYEEWNNALPYFKMTLILPDDRLNKLLKINSKVKIKVNYYNHFSGTFEYLLQDFNFSKESKNFYKVNLSGVLYAPNYIQSREQKLHDDFKSSVEKISYAAKKGGLNPKLEIPPTPDKEFWIQYNNTYKGWVDYLYSFSWKSNDDVILLAIQRDKTMVITSAKKIMSKGDILIQNKPGNLVWHDYDFNINFLKINFKLSPKREVQILKYLTNNLEKIKIPEKSVLTNKNYINISDYYPFTEITDCGWTHDNYKFAKKYNLVKRAQLYTYEINIRMQPKQNVNQLKLLEKIKFKDYFEGTDGQTLNTQVDGNYIIGKLKFTLGRERMGEVEVTGYRDFINE